MEAINKSCHLNSQWWKVIDGYDAATTGGCRKNYGNRQEEQKHELSSAASDSRAVV